MDGWMDAWTHGWMRVDIGLVLLSWSSAGSAVSVWEQYRHQFSGHDRGAEKVSAHTTQQRRAPAHRHARRMATQAGVMAVRDWLARHDGSPAAAAAAARASASVHVPGASVAGGHWAALGKHAMTAVMLRLVGYSRGSSGGALSQVNMDACAHW
eukprot:365265-Chlamydomonas_euryale.AAC.6